MKHTLTIGIDIGGTGIKGAVVDCANGDLISPRIRLSTPNGAEPAQVLEVVKTLSRQLKELHGDLHVGIGFPAKIINGHCHTAVNISEKWIGKNMASFFSSISDLPVEVGNDADVAALAELRFGATEIDLYGQALFLTLGTGIGSAIFSEGKMIPNTELGLMRFKGGIIERYASSKVREELNLSWKKWGKRLNKALHHFNRVLSPDIIILGGGISKKFYKFSDFIDLEIPVHPATLTNQAGIIGAALLAKKIHE